MLVTDNPTIVNFYKKYPSIEFEKINLFFIQIIENLFSEISTNPNEVTSLLKNINENILDLKSKNEAQLGMELLELRQDYTRDLQMVSHSAVNRTFQFRILAGS